MSAPPEDNDDAATKTASESKLPSHTFVPVSADAIRYVASALAIVFLFTLLPLIPEGPTVIVRLGFIGLFAGLHALSLVRIMRQGHGRKRCLLTSVMTVAVIAGGYAIGAVNPLLIVPGSTTKEVTRAIGAPLQIERWSDGGYYTGNRYSNFSSGNPMNPGSVRLSAPYHEFVPLIVKGEIYRYRNADLYFDRNGFLLHWDYAINRSPKAISDGGIGGP